MRLREIREAKGISQRQAALGMNLSPVLYNRYENGNREPPNALLPVFADYFGVTVDELLGRPPADEKMIPRTLEARIISGGVDQLPKDERDRILSVLQAMYSNYPDLFDYEKGDGENNES